jgi:hypothetical protein
MKIFEVEHTSPTKLLVMLTVTAVEFEDQNSHINFLSTCRIVEVDVGRIVLLYGSGSGPRLPFRTPR